MFFFIAYCVIVLLSFFILIPFLKVRTRYLANEDDPNITGAVFSAFWIVWAGYYIVTYCIAKPLVWMLTNFIAKPGARLFNWVENKFQPKEIDRLSNRINEARSGYRHVEFHRDEDDDYDPDREY